MTSYSYGDKQYIAVEGREKAFKLAAAIMDARNCQVLIQNDDADIYIVSWANRYSEAGGGGERFVFMSEEQYEDYEDMLAAARASLQAKLG